MKKKQIVVQPNSTALYLNKNNINDILKDMKKNHLKFIIKKDNRLTSFLLIISLI